MCRVRNFTSKTKSAAIQTNRIFFARERMFVDAQIGWKGWSICIKRTFSREDVGLEYCIFDLMTFGNGGICFSENRSYGILFSKARIFLWLKNGREEAGMACLNMLLIELLMVSQIDGKHAESWSNLGGRLPKITLWEWRSCRLPKITLWEWRSCLCRVSVTRQMSKYTSLDFL